MTATQTHASSLPTLDAERHALLARLTDGLDSGALHYIAGFAAALAAERSRQLRPAVEHRAGEAQVDSASRATILYASQTGNGRRIAERLARNLESQGLASRLVSTAEYRFKDLAGERLLYLVASTHGDGDPPDDARGFLDQLAGRRAPRLERLVYSVLALGDSSYPKFCETGRIVDERLAELGARRAVARIDCDVDFERAAEQWASQAVEAARKELQGPRLAVVTSVPRHATAVATRDQPFETEVLANQRITGRDSDRVVAHIELDAPAPQLVYEPGDSVGVWHVNPLETIEAIASVQRFDLAQPVRHDGNERPLRDWLLERREVTRLARPFLEAHAQRLGEPALVQSLSGSDPALLRTLLRDWQLLDLLEKYPARWSADEFVAALRPLTPRLYSIASSRSAFEGELHLTVAAVDYERHGARRFGAASRFLTHASLAEGSRLRAYIEPNPRFRLPEDAARDVIMIGPGTGVAPFRAFLQERVAVGASGRNWLFFGGRNLSSEFLYQSEWLEARRRGTLHRLNVAFSRDQDHKVYVQHRLREQGAELLRWIEDGASIYVCGDAQRMAPDVHAALLDVLEQHGGRSTEQAEETLAMLASERRYLRDVY